MAEPEDERFTLESNIRIRKRMDAAFDRIDPAHKDVGPGGVIRVSTWWSRHPDGHVIFRIEGPGVDDRTRPLFEAALIDSIHAEFPFEPPPDKSEGPNA